jgi:hypothetical protein
MVARNVNKIKSQNKSTKIIKSKRIINKKTTIKINSIKEKIKSSSLIKLLK